MMKKNKAEIIIEDFLLKNQNHKTEELFFSIALPVKTFDSINVLSNVETKETTVFFAKSDTQKISMIAFDSIYDIRMNHADKFQMMQREIESIQNRINTNYESVGIDNVPLVLGGIKFNEKPDNDMWIDFADSDWFFPKYIFLQQADKYFVILNYYKTLPLKNEILESFSEVLEFSKVINTKKSEVKIKEVKESAEVWDSIINAALKKIYSKQIIKVVLSRFKKFNISGRYKVSELIKKLYRNYSQTTVFLFKRNQSFFFGATPEIFLSKVKNEIKTDALAGSIKRGNSIDEDEKLATQLIQNPKERSEHEYVVKHIVNVLSKYSSNVYYDFQPGIKKLSNVQHLHTPIVAKLKNEKSVFNLISELYPTPAIGGLPVEVAKGLINELEKYPRGLYTGLLGWITQKNNLDLFIGIRSALIKNNLLFIFAGCGIVEGSNSLQEFQETEIKLKPIMNLFNNENTN